MPAATQITHVSQLRCVQCGLVYSRAAVAREITLATGVACRRCGGGLIETDEVPAERAEITAVRSPLSGPGRASFE